MAASLHYHLQEATVRVIVLAFAFVACSSSAPFAQAGTGQQPVDTTVRAEASGTVRDASGPTGNDGTTTQEQGAKLMRLQIGVALKATVAPGIDTGSSIKPTVVWRWRGKETVDGGRWSPTYGLSSFSSPVMSAVGGRELPVGDIQVRPLLIGVDYKVSRGKWRWTTGVSAGWAVNGVKTPSVYRSRIARQVGADDLWVDVHNSFVWGPRVTGWFERDRRVSYLVEAAYLVTRPEFDVRLNGVSSSRRIHADAAVLRVGVVYGIY